MQRGRAHKYEVINQVINLFSFSTNEQMKSPGLGEGLGK